MCDCDYILSDSDEFPEHYDNCSTRWKELHPGKQVPKNSDGTLRLPNVHLKALSVDVLYHLGLDTLNYDLPALFGDVKFVCVGGTEVRMREFAEYMAQVLDLPHKDEEPVNITKHSHRYAMYKAGPVLSVSHGIGISSMTTALQEVFKLLQYSKCRDPIVFRIGTSGGLGIPPGSVVVSTFGISGKLEKSYELPILGQVRKFSSILDQRLCREVYSLSSASDGYRTYLGGTMAADDFYRGQGRLDGPFCDYTEEDKMAYLSKLSQLGVKNIEMEATAFAAFTREAGVRGGIVCVTLLNRLLGDQVSTRKTTLVEWQKRPMEVVGRYILKYLNRNVISNTSNKDQIKIN